MTNSVSIFIQAFNMPMFFFLSGIVFNEKKYSCFGSFVKGRFNQLVIPYFFFYLLTWLLWLTIERSFRSFDMDWWEPLIGMVYASQWHGFMDHNGILWFLPCLFVVEVLFFFVQRIKPKYLQYIVVLSLLMIGMSVKDNLPWCLNTACVALQFYFCGHEMKELLFYPVHSCDINKNKGDCSRVLLLVIFAALFFAIEGFTKNSALMIGRKYGNPIVYEVAAFSGILMMVYFGKVLSPSNELLTPALNWVLFLGKNTLLIFALHSFFLRILRYVFEHLTHISSYDTNIFWAVLMDLIVVALLCPLVPLYSHCREKFLSKFYLK